ncbi:hypothetical protein SAMN04515647_4119 [Cohaesibacter sp. ES.047]|uniref:hypothetical protein n=1 Tax=Cohaesibacter sp. ES.047 TaxID=1798205 RepID=UPI000BB71179|nr:hypothetical protein [Cohaesibacter sp. ES.047]SNY93798.1 hypothetical protein SAMN04515647_4119 [Cohaesibacter sp. ES.047]
MTVGQFVKPIILLSATLVLLASQVASSQAACLVNVTDRSLILFMKSPVERIERSFPIGARVCQTVSDQTVVEAHILPYVGARFGCEAEIKGQQVLRLRHFGTMNKCEFE